MSWFPSTLPIVAVTLHKLSSLFWWWSQDVLSPDFNGEHVEILRCLVHIFIGLHHHRDLPSQGDDKWDPFPPTSGVFYGWEVNDQTYLRSSLFTRHPYNPSLALSGAEKEATSHLLLQASRLTFSLLYPWEQRGIRSGWTLYDKPQTKAPFRLNLCLHISCIRWSDLSYVGAARWQNPGVFSRGLVLPLAAII